MVVPKAWKKRAPRLSTIAAWINANTELVATITKSWTSTDTKIRGARLRRPGKGRRGWRLDVHESHEARSSLLTHDSSHGYRRNAEVVEWLERRLKETSR